MLKRCSWRLRNHSDLRYKVAIPIAYQAIASLAMPKIEAPAGDLGTTAKSIVRRHSRLTLEHHFGEPFARYQLVVKWLGDNEHSLYQEGV